MSPPSQFNKPPRRASTPARHESITPAQEYCLRKLSFVSGQNELELAREQLQAQEESQAHNVDDQPQSPEPLELPVSTAAPEDTDSTSSGLPPARLPPRTKEPEIQVVDAEADKDTDTFRCVGCSCQKIMDWIRLRCGLFHNMLRYV